MKLFKRISLFFICTFLAGALYINADAVIVQNYNNYATSVSCTLQGAETVNYHANLLTLPASDDGLIYLYALQPYEYSVSVADTQVASAPLSMNPSFSFALKNAGGSMICKKFAMAVKTGGALTTISGGYYITNPEAAATSTRAPQNVGFVEPYEKMVLYRIGETDLNAVKRDNYSTAVIVNKINRELKSPYASKGDSHPVSPRMYYAFNASTANGVMTLQNTMANFAACTNVDEFIIGNEVNTRIWNYMAYMDWDLYVREYAQAFRVAYNAIKSTNANAKVYISLDQAWNMSELGLSDSYSYIDGADFLILFNSFINAEGNIDWGLAYHPYPSPMTYAKFWDTSGLRNASYYNGLVAGGKQVTFQNLPFMTSFMSLPAMKNPAGQIRSVILPEIGITSAQGVEVQAAAMMACYQACKNNPVIKRIYFHRMNEGGALNFGTSGISEQVYRALLAGDPGQYNNWALNYIGISDWHQIVSY